MTVSVDQQLDALRVRMDAAEREFRAAIEEISDVADTLVKVFPRAVAEGSAEDQRHFTEIAQTIMPILNEFSDFAKRLGKIRNMKP